jgi:preprotein translocase subunit SecF
MVPRTTPRRREGSFTVTMDSVFTYVLTILTMVMFMVGVWYVFNGSMSKDPNVLLLIGTVIGYLASNSQMALSYYFGSSASSKQKTYAMSNNMADFPER